jgi:hypothetical protein
LCKFKYLMGGEHEGGGSWALEVFNEHFGLIGVFMGILVSLLMRALRDPATPRFDNFEDEEDVSQEEEVRNPNEEKQAPVNNGGNRAQQQGNSVARHVLCAQYRLQRYSLSPPPLTRFTRRPRRLGILDADGPRGGHVHPGARGHYGQDGAEHDHQQVAVHHRADVRARGASTDQDTALQRMPATATAAAAAAADYPPAHVRVPAPAIANCGDRGDCARCYARMPRDCYTNAPPSLPFTQLWLWIVCHGVRSAFLPRCSSAQVKGFFFAAVDAQECTWQLDQEGGQLRLWLNLAKVKVGGGEGERGG